MLERPDIDESKLLTQVESQFDLLVKKLTFLPLGYDMHTAVYRVIARDGKANFLKLRMGQFNPITVEVPHFLASQGIPAIIAPLSTRSGKLYAGLEDYTLILYPFIEGQDGYQVRLEDRHWVKLGSTLRRVHEAQLPPELAQRIPHETYDPTWRESVKDFLKMVEEQTFTDPVAIKVAAFMQSKKSELESLVQHTEALAQLVQKQSPEYVLCHTDAHPGNYHITPDGKLYLVDWDAPLLAPKERDLMFFGGGMSDDMPGGREESLFYQGYGRENVNAESVNAEALAYYRYERIIQDIAEFCKQLLLSDAGGDDREQAYQYLTSSFEPGHVLEAARLTEEYYEIPQRKR